MSDQRRTALSHFMASRRDFASSPGLARYLAGLRRRLPLYALGVLLAILVLAWIDGGAEPLHPITQVVDLNAPVAETE